MDLVHAILLVLGVIAGVIVIGLAAIGFVVVKLLSKTVMSAEEMKKFLEKEKE